MGISNLLDDGGSGSGPAREKNIGEGKREEAIKGCKLQGCRTIGSFTESSTSY